MKLTVRPVGTTNLKKKAIFLDAPIERNCFKATIFFNHCAPQISPHFIICIERGVKSSLTTKKMRGLSGVGHVPRVPDLGPTDK